MTTASPKPDVARRARELLTTAFHAAPAAIGWAPGRVNLIGEHVDYCGGYVLPVAIERQTVVAAAANSVGRIRAVSENAPPNHAEAALADLRPGVVDGWFRYVAGAAARALGPLDGRSFGIDLAIASDVPIGGGLSSSAALEVAVASACLRLIDKNMSGRELASACRDAEHQFAGVPCGLMDQYIVALAQEDHALLIDCSTETHRALPIGDEVRIVIAHCGVSHTLSDSEYGTRRASCERTLAAVRAAGLDRPTLRHCSPEDLAAASIPPIDRQRAGHVIRESRRTVDAAAALERQDWRTFGRLMLASHASLRDDFKVSCAELDDLVALATRLPGVYGARMTGGGFGGCVVALCHQLCAAVVLSALQDSTIRPDACLVTRPAAGAGSIALGGRPTQAQSRRQC